jgi:hypothetical protein
MLGMPPADVMADGERKGAVIVGELGCEFHKEAAVDTLRKIMKWEMPKNLP